MGQLFDDAILAFCDEAESGAAAMRCGEGLTRAELQRFAHQLCGSAGLFGASRTAFVAAAIGAAFRRSKTDDAELKALIEELLLQIHVDCLMLRSTLPSIS